MPRAFLIHQKSKAKKAKADSTSEDIMDSIAPDCEEVRCMDVGTPARGDRAGSGELISQTANKAAQWASNASFAEIHLSRQNSEGTDSPQSDIKQNRSQKRPLGNYGILYPLNYTKKMRLDENEQVGDNGRELNNNCTSVDNKDNFNMSPGSVVVKQEIESPEQVSLVKKSKLSLPVFNNCYQSKNDTLQTMEFHSPSPKSKSSHYSPNPKDSRFSGVKAKVAVKAEREMKKSRPFLPHPYFSPLKIDVPHFEPSPDKLSAFSKEMSDQKLYFSPLRGNTSSPIEKPLFVDTLSRNQDRVSDSDSASEKSPLPSDEEFYRESDSDSEVPLGDKSMDHHEIKYSQVMNRNNDKNRDSNKQKVVSPRKYPKEMLAPHTTAPTIGFKPYDPHFWQNNMHHIQMMEYAKKLAPMHSLPMPEYSLLHYQHYLTYLSALEKSGLGYMPNVFRPEFPHPLLVNPALMDPRYMQYHAEQMKCHSPAYTPPMFTPQKPFPAPTMEKVTVNEQLHSLERPRSIESNASDKLSSISEESSITDAVTQGSGRASSQTKHHCEWCGKTYSTFSGLTKHKQFHCSKQVTKQFNCQHCNKEYTSLGALKMHIRTHTLPCKCNICGKAFSRPWLLQGHIRTHTGEKPFSCQHCSRAFADRSNLRAHLQTHSEVKKYSCDKCNKTFSRMSLLVKHKESGCIGQ